MLQFACYYQGFSRITGCSKYHGSGQEVSKLSRVGSGPIGSGQQGFQVSGRVRPGQEFFQNSRVGSGQVGSRDEKLTGKVRS